MIKIEMSKQAAEFVLYLLSTTDSMSEEDYVPEAYNAVAIGLYGENNDPE